MAKGVEITLPGDLNVAVIPNSPGQMVLVTIDDISIIAREDDAGWQVDLKADGLASGGELDRACINEFDGEIEQTNSADVEHSILRTCINCRGRQYCITGGCARTPCGWICG